MIPVSPPGVSVAQSFKKLRVSEFWPSGQGLVSVHRRVMVFQRRLQTAACCCGPRSRGHRRDDCFLSTDLLEASADTENFARAIVRASKALVKTQDHYLLQRFSPCRLCHSFLNVQNARLVPATFSCSWQRGTIRPYTGDVSKEPF